MTQALTVPFVPDNAPFTPAQRAWLNGFLAGLFAQAPSALKMLGFSVLALVNTNYEQFCGFGKKVDKRLEELGAKRIFERVDCPVNFEEGASRWRKGVFEAVSKLAGPSDAQLNDSKGALIEVSALATAEEKPAG